MVDPYNSLAAETSTNEVSSLEKRRQRPAQEKTHYGCDWSYQCDVAFSEFEEWRKHHKAKHGNLPQGLVRACTIYHVFCCSTDWPMRSKTTHNLHEKTDKHKYSKLIGK